MAVDEKDFREQLAAIGDGDVTDGILTKADPDEITTETEETVADEQQSEEKATELQEGEEEENTAPEGDAEDQPMTRGRLNKEIAKTTAEREARIRAEAELAAYKRAMEELKGVTGTPEAAAEVEDIPDPDYDPDGYRDYMAAKEKAALDARLAELESQAEANRKAAAIQQVSQKFVNDITGKVKDGSMPDAIAAYNHLLAVKKAEIADIVDSPEQAKVIMDAYLESQASQATARGQNTADRVMMLAENFGYIRQKAGDPAKGTKGDLGAVEKNRAKGASTSGMASGESKIGGNAGTVEATFNTNGRGVDEDKFRKYVESKKNG